MVRMKKRTLYTIFCMILVFMLSTVVEFAADSAYLGDADGNGKVNAADARIILRHSANLGKVADEFAHLADINSDEKITAADARIALRMSASLEELFKFGEEYHLHDYETVFVKNATCTEEGKKQDVCKICSKITKESVVEKNHILMLIRLKKKLLVILMEKNIQFAVLVVILLLLQLKNFLIHILRQLALNKKTCRICGVTQGNKKEHDYVTSSCFSPATCKNCGTTSGKAPGHTFSGLKCTKCGKQYNSMEDYAVTCIKNDLMYRLKNPNSLIINRINYTIPNSKDCVFVLWINISAMNGFGGYTRETIYYGIDNSGKAYYVDLPNIRDTTMRPVDLDYVEKQLGLN